MPRAKFVFNKRRSRKRERGMRAGGCEWTDKKVGRLTYLNICKIERKKEPKSRLGPSAETRVLNCEKAFKYNKIFFRALVNPSRTKIKPFERARLGRCPS